MMKRSMILMTVLLTLATIAGAQELPILTSDAALGPGDVISVRVLEDPKIDNDAARISDDGFITLNILSRVNVSGLSAPEIAARLETMLEANYLERATVTVEVKELASKPISVVGAVVRPGRLTATGTVTLIQAITQAGGLATNHGRDLYVLRSGASGITEQLTIPVEELLIAGNPDYNIPLSPNDLVNVPVETPVTVYVMGEVMRPGKAQFRSSQTPTLLQAIADAGGPTDRAGREAIITRHRDGKQERIVVNYRDIISGRKADPVLQDNDTIVLRESFF
jgi:polysaccharide export outer membrane protein